jgi:hypothetical protein
MKSMENPSVIRDIEDSFQRLHDDPSYQASVAKIDSVTLHNDFLSLQQSFVTFLNYYAYRGQMRALKVRSEVLSDSTEKTVLARAEEALVAYKDAVNSLEAINLQLNTTGLAKSIDQHADAIFKNFNYNPRMPVVVDRFREMGASGGAITWMIERLRNADFKILSTQRLDGTRGDGKFGGLVAHAASLVPRLEEATRIHRQHGLPLIEGAGSQSGPYGDAAAAIVSAILVGLIFAW